MTNKIHEGHNVKRFREMLRIKPDALAAKLGEDWTPKKISLLEEKDTIEPAILEQIAGALKMPVEAFKNFEENTTVNISSNTVTNTSSDTSTITNTNSDLGAGAGTNNTINNQSIDELIKMREEKIALIEQTLLEKGLLPDSLVKLIEKGKQI